jgi:hypothetical protein
LRDACRANSGWAVIATHPQSVKEDAYSKSEGHLPLPDRCSLDVSCFKEPEIQEALAIAIEETLYLVALSGIELHALDGVTVAPDCRAAACALQNLPEGEVPLEMNPQPEVMEMARTAAVRREGDSRFHIVLRPGLGLMTLSADAEMQRVARACIAHEAAHVEHESRAAGCASSRPLSGFRRRRWNSSARMLEVDGDGVAVNGVLLLLLLRQLLLFGLGLSLSEIGGMLGSVGTVAVNGVALGRCHRGRACGLGAGHTLFCLQLLHRGSHLLLVLTLVGVALRLQLLL